MINTNTRVARDINGRMQVQVSEPGRSYKFANHWKPVRDAIDAGTAIDIEKYTQISSTGVEVKGWRWQVDVLRWISIGRWEQKTGEKHSYSADDFFAGTAAGFTPCEMPEGEPDYHSYESSYWYTDTGVVRRSNHWGRAASCYWSYDGEESKGFDAGFCRWEDFRPNE